MTEELDVLRAGQRLLDSVTHFVVTTDADGVITSFNPAAERALGYTSEDCVGKLTPLVYRDPREVVERAAALTSEPGTLIEPGIETLVAMARRGLVEGSEWTYVCKDGSRFAALVSTTALRDAAGNFTAPSGRPAI